MTLSVFSVKVNSILKELERSIKIQLGSTYTSCFLFWLYIILAIYMIWYIGVFPIVPDCDNSIYPECGAAIRGKGKVKIKTGYFCLFQVYIINLSNPCSIKLDFNCLHKHSNNLEYLNSMFFRHFCFYIFNVLPTKQSAKK